MGRGVMPHRLRSRPFPIRSSCECADLLYVVPAKAGTHNHQSPKFSTIVPQRERTAYGSPLSRGRRQGMAFATIKGHGMRQALPKSYLHPGCGH